MKRKLLAAVLTLACVFSMGVPAFALSGAPELTKTSEHTVTATCYAYKPFDEGNSGMYINEVYCETAKPVVTADNGRTYYFEDPTVLTDGSFIVSLKYSDNANMVKSMKLADSAMRNSDNPAYAIRLSDSAVLNDIYVGFTATFTPKKLITVKVREAGRADAKTVDLTIGTKAKIVLEHRVNVDYDKLNRLQFTPKYTYEVELGEGGPNGVEGDVMYPRKTLGADLTWESIGEICAEVNYGSGSIEYAPKLSAFWPKGSLIMKFKERRTFIRDFNTCSVTGKVELVLTNPFLNIEGKETIPHGDVVIYKYADGKLTDITKSFTYTKNSDGIGAFKMTADSLDTYIFSDGKIR